MLLNKFKKRFLLPISLLVFIIGFLGIYNYYNNSIPSVYAKINEDDPQLFGYAWTETFGWISFNCYNQDTCGAVNYGITINPGTGKLSGYAWSEYAGWINFEAGTPDGESNYCVTNGYCSGEDCGSCYNTNERQFHGWARVEVLEDDGWIKLNNEGSGITFYTSVKNETEGENWGDLQGWAWNGNDTPKTGLGWLSFNCSNNDSCGTANYKVTGKPTKPVISSVVRTPGEESHSLTVNWNSNVLGEERFGLYRCMFGVDEGGNEINCDQANQYSVIEYDDGSAVSNLEKNSINFADGSAYPPSPKKVRLDMNEEYAYKVRACNIFACVDSNISNKKTSPIMEAGDFAVSGFCDDDTNIGYVLEWTKPAYAEGKEINYYEVEYCVVDTSEDLNDCGEADWETIESTDDCYEVCRDNWQNSDENGGCYYSSEYGSDIEKPERCDSLSDNNKYNMRYYRVRGVHDKEEDEVGSWKYSNASRACMPPSQPQYRETRPE